MFVRILILCFALSACGSVSEPIYYPTDPVVSTETDEPGVTTERVLVAPAPGHFPTVVFAGPEELGDWYAMVVPSGDARIELADWIIRSTGQQVTVAECAPTGASIAVSARPGGGAPAGVPTPTGSIAGGLGLHTIPAPGAGPWLLAVQLDAGVCLRGTRGPDPIAPGAEWWVTQSGDVRDMAQGGGSPQCDGPCPWYTRVAR